MNTKSIISGNQVTVTEIHRKGLQKERVPINIEVAPTIPKGALR
jgi:hypothetical protein